MSNESTDHELPIRNGGEDMHIFDIMDRFRNDGSCERIIQTALIQMAKAQHAEADAQREPERPMCPVCQVRPSLVTGNVKTSWDTCEICTGRAVQELIDHARSRPTVAEIRASGV